MNFHNVSGDVSGFTTVVATKNSLYTSDTRVHTLQTVWDVSRRLSEGAKQTQIKSDAKHGLYCPEDPVLDSKISDLHEIARSGAYYHCIQTHMDCYLAAAAFAKENPGRLDVARMMVCNHTISPQEGNLPDLCPLIRSMMEGSVDRFGGSHAMHCLYIALPCIRRPAKKQAKIQGDYQISLNLVLALLLGLYPSSLKFPQFCVRVEIFRRIHCLLTHGGGSRFCETFVHIVTLAYMEYASHVLAAYMPVEFEILQREQGMASFLQTCSMACDAFRQEVLVTGREHWSAIDAACTHAVEKHTRYCKNRLRVKSTHMGQCVKVEPGVSSAFLSLPFIHPYVVHHEDPSHCIMAGELKFLADGMGAFRLLSHQPNFSFENAVTLQRMLNVHMLPRNLLHIQMKSLARRARLCERSAVNGTKLFLCVPCIMRSPNTLKPSMLQSICKMDVTNHGFVCSHCSNADIVNADVLGKILCIRSQRYYYAPCCNSIQVYTGRGDEFHETIDSSTLMLRVACHHQKPKTQQRLSRHRCAVCCNVAYQEELRTVNHLTGELHSVYLCNRHMPNGYALRQAVNWEQLTEEILKRDKPLFSLTTVKKSNKR